MQAPNRYIDMALECEAAARGAGPDEERSLLFLARRFRVLAEYATGDEPACDIEHAVYEPPQPTGCGQGCDTVQ